MPEVCRGNGGVAHFTWNKVYHSGLFLKGFQKNKHKDNLVQYNCIYQVHDETPEASLMSYVLWTKHFFAVSIYCFVYDNFYIPFFAADHILSFSFIQTVSGFVSFRFVCCEQSRFRSAGASGYSGRNSRISSSAPGVCSWLSSIPVTRRIVSTTEQ